MWRIVCKIQMAFQHHSVDVMNMLMQETWTTTNAQFYYIREMFPLCIQFLSH